MVFASPVFLFVFLPAFLLVYRLLPAKARTYWTLVGSLIFYAWGEPTYILLMVAAIAVTWAGGFFTALAQDKSKRQLAGVICAVAVLAILSSLIWYKYAYFLVTTLKGLLHTKWRFRSIAMPIGISFYTFQAMSYLWDVRRGKIQPIRNPLKLGAYIAMFPQLIAGPIVRAVDVTAALDAPEMTLDGVSSGMRRFIIGLGKKVILANSLAVSTQHVFAMRAGTQSAGLMWLTMLCYAFQIYYDFSGYSDMAIGLGQMLGFRFPENFNFPYTAVSVRDFWRRWHITLSAWLRDYVYIPLGGSRKGTVRTMLNLLIVFLICGFWHGASWNYVIWGLWYGLWMMVERIPAVQRILERVPKPIRWAGTMVIVLIGWMLFQEGDTALYLRTMFGLVGSASYTAAAIVTPKLLIVLAASVLLASPLGSRVKKVLEYQNGGAVGIIGAAVLLAVLAVCVMLMMANTYNPFIYFRF